MKSLAGTVKTIKFFMMSMLILLTVISVLVFWLIFRVIQSLPKNTSESQSLLDVRMLSSEVGRVYESCLAEANWSVKNLKVGEVLEGCVNKTKETEAYKRLVETYGIEALPTKK